MKDVFLLFPAGKDGQKSRQARQGGKRLGSCLSRTAISKRRKGLTMKDGHMILPSKLLTNWTKK